MTMRGYRATGAVGVPIVAAGARLLILAAFGLVAMTARTLAQESPEILLFTTPGQHTFEVPPAVSTIVVELWGAGGRGGTRTSNGTGGGGGGGAYARAELEVAPGAVFNLSVGAGSTTTSPGQDSWFGGTSAATATLLAKGGASAADNSMLGAPGGSGPASVVPTGGVTWSGGNGAEASWGMNNNTRWGGGGGSSAGRHANGNSGTQNMGGLAPEGGGPGGGGATSNNASGQAGSAPGGGGGGARKGSGTQTRYGGAGAAGRVVVTFEPAAPIARVPLFLSLGLPPNILMILDNSDSMQEGLSLGRVALDWDDPNCVPGEAMDADLCPAGARSPFSKASSVKRVGTKLVDQYQGRISLGLMAYQQYPPSQYRDAVFNVSTSQNVPASERPASVLWRLTHRPGDLRYAPCNPDVGVHPAFYDPEFDGGLVSPTKRFYERHPTIAGYCVYYNFAAPGYLRDTTEGEGTPTLDDTSFAHFRNFNVEFPYRLYYGMVDGTGVFNDPDSGLGYLDDDGRNWRITLTDSMRQRGIQSWGTRVGFTQLNQLEWRANHSPGLGYLHVPIGGFDADGRIDSAHWQAIRNKLQPQRHDWTPRARSAADYVNVLVDPSWPLIAAGLTPLQGTIRTAKDYFQGSSTHFGPAQGNIGNPSVPESCDINAVVWVTDGLPTVRADGTELGTDPVTAVAQAADAIGELHDGTAVSMVNRVGSGNPVKTYIVGFARPPGVDSLFGGANPLDLLAEAGGTGASYNAESEADLDAAMAEIFSTIVAESKSSGASVAANSTRVDTDTLVFQARFDSRDWSGEVLAFPFLVGGAVAATPKWNTNDPGTFDPPPARNILTWNGSAGLDFTEANWESLAAVQRAALESGDGEAMGRARLRWLRGDQADEGTLFRERTVLLGDIIYSNPYFVGRPDFGFASLDGAEGEEYLDFRSSDAYRNRSDMVYVGANDGMLHGFNAGTGKEQIAFIPKGVYAHIAELTDPEYQHRFYVDGSPRVVDAYIDRGSGHEWRTILVGSTAAGGRSVFALDVTNPDDIGPQDVLWEYEAGELGFAFGQPTIARLPTPQNADPRWVAIFGNGYHGPSDTARLIVLDLSTGSVLRVIDTGAGTAQHPNGLSEVVPVFVSPDRITHYVYAGDLQGNLWKFDLTSSNVNNWDVAYKQGNNPIPLFTARDAGGETQPITTRPLVVAHPNAGFMVLFGTGKYYEIGDDRVDPDTQVQTFYGVHDTGSAITAARDSALQGQSILFQGSIGFTDDDGTAFTRDVRVTTDHAVTGTQRGWYIDLIYQGVVEGERVITRAIFRNGFVVFSTVIPHPDPCGIGAESWLMELQVLDGARPATPVLDVSEDGQLDELDLITLVDADGNVVYDAEGNPVKVPASGTRPINRRGMFGSPTVLEGGAIDYKVLSTTEGTIEVIREQGSGAPRRESWRQLR